MQWLIRIMLRNHIESLWLNRVEIEMGKGSINPDFMIKCKSAFVELGWNM